MPARDFGWSMTMRGLAVLAVLALLVPEHCAGQDKKPLPKPLPEKIVQQWKDAGAEVSWLRVDRDGSLQFISATKGVPSDLPAFRFNSWRENVLSKLPVPPEPFGLALGGTQVTDTGLKELAGLKN